MSEGKDELPPITINIVDNIKALFKPETNINDFPPDKLEELEKAKKFIQNMGAGIDFKINK